MTTKGAQEKGNQEKKKEKEHKSKKRGGFFLWGKNVFMPVL